VVAVVARPEAREEVVTSNGDKRKGPRAEMKDFSHF
jgi:hypothetical protein